MTLTYQSDQVLLDVIDNGQGFNPAEIADTSKGYGLPTARRRVMELGGTLSIESTPGDSTGISARIPTPNPAPSTDT